MKGEERIALLKEKLAGYARVFLRDTSQLFSITHHPEDEIYVVRTAIIFRHQDQFCFILDDKTGETIKIFTDIEGRGVEGFDDPTDEKWDAERGVKEVMQDMSSPTVRFEYGLTAEELAEEEQDEK